MRQRVIGGLRRRGVNPDPAAWLNPWCAPTEFRRFIASNDPLNEFLLDGNDDAVFTHCALPFGHDSLQLVRRYMPGSDEIRSIDATEFTNSRKCLSATGFRSFITLSTVVAAIRTPELRSLMSSSATTPPSISVAVIWLLGTMTVLVTRASATAALRPFDFPDS
jgi:hypothetical protein